VQQALNSFRWSNTKATYTCDPRAWPTGENAYTHTTTTGHENKNLLSEAINSFRLFDILKLWEAVHFPWEAVPERYMKKKVTFFQ
jgi:hypothetical protein